ncbi:MAG: type II toxin-antitoxin system RelE/ParE family toxin [Planctomycetaceae bacterium]
MVRYHPLFDCDVREAAEWYDRRSPGLGDRFVEAVRVAVDSVIENPDTFSFSPAGVRYARTAKFPYVVLFDIEGESLSILGVLHTARSRDKWRERLGDRPE